jgi:hypothetical protein
MPHSISACDGGWQGAIESQRTREIPYAEMARVLAMACRLRSRCADGLETLDEVPKD